MRVHLRQPEGSSLCGQTVVAMILGITLEEAIALVGKRGATSRADLERALGERGWKLWGPIPGPPPTNGSGLYLCVVRWPRKGAHWLLLDGGRWLDPEGSYRWPPGSRITSHHEVMKKATE